MKLWQQTYRVTRDGLVFSRLMLVEAADVAAARLAAVAAIRKDHGDLPTELLDPPERVPLPRSFAIGERLA